MTIAQIVCVYNSVFEIVSEFDMFEVSDDWWVQIADISW